MGVPGGAGETALMIVMQFLRMVFAMAWGMFRFMLRFIMRS